mmetsp:Transcript_21105/g.54859  ORF Transcript_21105/g.54859 Transcript_21105/m.54859 type:complete len:208 (-) Transcript_21105:1162-1785(-)
MVAPPRQEGGVPRPCPSRLPPPPIYRQAWLRHIRGSGGCGGEREEEEEEEKPPVHLLHLSSRPHVSQLLPPPPHAPRGWAGKEGGKQQQPPHSWPPSGSVRARRPPSHIRIPASTRRAQREVDIRIGRNEKEEDDSRGGGGGADVPAQTDGGGHHSRPAARHAPPQKHETRCSRILYLAAKRAAQKEGEAAARPARVHLGQGEEDVW